MHKVTGHHRNPGMPNKVPRSATFKPKKAPMGEHATFSGTSKRKAK